jgi:hypothetical protein
MDFFLIWVTYLTCLIVLEYPGGGGGDGVGGGGGGDGGGGGVDFIRTSYTS